MPLPACRMQLRAAWHEAEVNCKMTQRSSVACTRLFFSICSCPEMAAPLQGRHTQRRWQTPTSRPVACCAAAVAQVQDLSSLCSRRHLQACHRQAVQASASRGPHTATSRVPTTAGLSLQRTPADQHHVEVFEAACSAALAAECGGRLGQD